MADPDVPYRSEYEPELGQVFMTTAEVRTHPPGPKPSHVIGRGPCPRCGHEVEVYHRTTTQSFFGNDPIEFRQPCTCDAEHFGAPKDVKGCGIVWKVAVSHGE